MRRLSSKRSFALRRLRQRPGRTVLLIVVLAAALAPLAGVYVEHSSVDRAKRDLGIDLAGPSPIRLVGSTLKGGLSPSLVDEVRSLPEIAVAVPAVQAVTLVESQTAPVIVVGIACQDAGLLRDLKCDPSVWDTANAPLVTSPGLLKSLVPGLKLRTTNGGVNFTDAKAASSLADINGGRVVLTGLVAAQRDFVRGSRLDVIYVVPAADVTLDQARVALTARVGSGVRVLDATDPPPGPDVAGPISALLGLLGLFALAVGWFLVRSIGRLGLLERETEIAVERAVGRTRATILFDLFSEACVVGAVGGVLGGFAGWGVGALLVHGLSGLISDYTGAATSTQFQPVVPLIFGFAGITVVVLGMGSSWLSASRTEITDVAAGQQAASTSDSLPRWRGIGIGAVAIVAGLALSETAVGPALLNPVGFLLAGIGLLGVLGGAFTVAGGLGPRILSFIATRSPDGSRRRLALSNLVAHSRQLSAIVLAVTFAVTLAVALAGFEPGISDASRSVTLAGMGDRFAVNSLDFNDSALIDAKIGPATIRRIAAVTGGVVSRETFTLTRARSANLNKPTPGEEVAIMASERPNFAYPVLRGADTNDVLASGQAAIGAPLARGLQVSVGDEVVLDSPSGPISVTVGGVLENLNNAGLVAIVPINLLDNEWGWQPPDPLLIDALPGTTAAGLTDQLQAIDPHLRAVDAGGLAAETASSLDTYFGPFNALRNCLFGVVALAAFTALTLVGWQRRREYALLAAVGLSPAELRALVVGEAVVLASIGAIQGIIAGLLISEPLRNMASFALGVRPGLQLDLAVIAASLVAAVAVVIVASLPPARRLAHLDLQVALSE